MSALCLAAISLLLVVFAIFAPCSLFIEDAPLQADAVVLFVGPDNETRLFEARRLIKEGYARYLLIPASGEIFSADKIEEIEKINLNQTQGNPFLRNRMEADYGKHYENSHVEVLEAKRMLDGLGLRSALMVSSGYHMRRIRLIAGRVFNTGKYSYSCNPAQWQPVFTAADWLDKDKSYIIISEYVKMGWFLVYALFETIR